MSTSTPAPTKAPTQAPTRPETTPDTSSGDGDHDRFAHYVREADLTRAYVEGNPVKALCGKIWVPSRDPDRYKVCPTCREIKERFGQA